MTRRKPGNACPVPSSKGRLFELENMGVTHNTIWRKLGVGDSRETPSSNDGGETPSIFFLSFVLGFRRPASPD